jgi:hypothetical protein
MTPKQAKELAEIEDKLLDVFIAEADPDQWPVVNNADPPKEQQTARGDRYWCAKVANQTMALLTRIVTYRTKLNDFREGNKVSQDDDAAHAADMKAAEKKVTARLSLVKKRAA